MKPSPCADLRSFVDAAVWESCSRQCSSYSRQNIDRSPCALLCHPLSGLHVGFLFETRFGDWFWFFNSRAVVKKFRYALDPLCLVCCALYGLNRWGIKPHTEIAFFRFWFNDLLLIPCALPPLLQVHRWLRWRRDDRPPMVSEIAGHLLLWSLLFEAIGPHVMSGVTGDWRDVVAYALGAFVALCCWNGHRIIRARGT